MMCAHVLKPHAEEKQTRFTRFTERQWRGWPLLTTAA